MNSGEGFLANRSFIFLTGIAVTGMSMAIGFNLMWGNLAPSNNPLPGTAIYDLGLRNALANYRDALSRPRVAFTASSPQGTQTVANCRDYMRLLDQGIRSLPTDPPGVAEAYQDCPLLFLLRQASQPALYLAPLSYLTETVAERLDPETLNADFRPPRSRRDSSHSAQDRYWIDNRSLRISAADGKWSMTILASGSFSGDGREDVAVRINCGSNWQYAILTSKLNGSLAAISPESLVMTTGMPVRLR